MNAALLEEALHMSPEARLELIAILWDTLADAEIPVSDEERAIIEARLADLEANPADQRPWSEVKADLAKRRP
jgi:putative addiction module component (TIGR02574 family)